MITLRRIAVLAGIACIALINPTTVYGQAARKLVAFAPKTYFYSEPNFKTKKAAYLVPPDNVAVLKEVPDFVYAEFKNSKGQLTKGWLAKIDLITDENREEYLLSDYVMEEYAGKLGNDPIKLVCESTRNNIYSGYLEIGSETIGVTGIFTKGTQELKMQGDSGAVYIAKLRNSGKLMDVKLYSSDRLQIKTFTLKAEE